ncbi:MAG: hypothetical protein ACI85U_002223 [Candidatus Promineifilaceae bacterium]|jgi:hypothetical protein
MSDFDLSKSYHQFFDKELAENYLQGYSWHGHNQIPSFLTTGTLHFVAIIANQVTFEAIRHEIINFHSANVSKVELYCIHQKYFENFLYLNPSFGHRLDQYAWSSSNSIESTPDEFESNGSYTHENDGWLAWQMMQATADLYNEPSDRLRLISLLAPENDQNDLAEDDFGTTSEILSRLIEHLSLEGAEKIGGDPKGGSAPPLNFPDPVAIYLKLDQLILVTNNLVEALATISGQQEEPMVKWMEDRSATAVQICTPAQLIKAIEAEDLINARLMSYQHIWGINVITKVKSDQNAILKSAAKVASYWQFYGVGAQLFASPGDVEADRKTIHDLQNRLLNIRLQNELFSRFGLSEKGIPSVNIPDRAAPVAERLKAIEDLFRWWTDFYINQISDG